MKQLQQFAARRFLPARDGAESALEKRERELALNRLTVDKWKE
jgi:hypothetical protein